MKEKISANLDIAVNPEGIFRFEFPSDEERPLGLMSDRQLKKFIFDAENIKIAGVTLYGVALSLLVVCGMRDLDTSYSVPIVASLAGVMYLGSSYYRNGSNSVCHGEAEALVRDFDINKRFLRRTLHPSNSEILTYLKF